MKRVIALIALAIIFASCKTNRNTAQIQYVKAEEPMHIKDRRINEQGKNLTENSGASGAGSGSSYGSTSFRQSAIKASENQKRIVAKTNKESTKRW